MYIQIYIYIERERECVCKQHGKHNAEAASDFVPNFNFSSSSEARRTLGFLKLMLMLHDKFKIPEMQWHAI